MKWLVAVLRVLVGATFIVSGWAKCIDIWGFVYKIDEYLNVWHMPMPHELIVIAAGFIAITEFITGILVATGSFRRVGVILAALIMAVMLPLTAWIVIADPISDCGCFGDFIILSNAATLLKNIVLTALIITLLCFNRRLRPMYRPELQWMVVSAAGLFALTVATIGYQRQPLIDFRPFPPGSVLKETSEPQGIAFIYEKDGEEREFTLDCLPDSTWTFVESYTIGSEADEFVVLDEFGDDVTDEVIADEGPQLLFVVTNPGVESLSRLHLAERFGAYVDSIGGSMIALVGTSDPERLERWRHMAMPDFDSYCVEPTSLKTLVRGNSALVMLHNGVVCWKRRLAYFPADFFDDPEADRAILTEPCVASAKADAEAHMWLCAIFLTAMIIIYIFNYTFKSTRPKPNTDEKKSPDNAGSDCSHDAADHDTSCQPQA